MDDLLEYTCIYDYNYIHVKILHGYTCVTHLTTLKLTSNLHIYIYIPSFYTTN